MPRNNELQAAFRPLNVIFEDEESDEEIDDSKELQIEEALKFYQNALKLHSQGPDFFAEADEAYAELFRSEVFTYPESLSESNWLELYGDAELDDDEAEYEGPEVSGPTASSDPTPSSLPQILYLAYKNYGQFRLDQLEHRLTQLGHDLHSGDGVLIDGEIAKAANTGLEQLAEAIGRDESDLELWRRVSRLSEYLGSRRTARFCLETVVDDEDFDPDGQGELPGLEERFAAEQLRHVLSKIGDSASEDQQRMLFKAQKALPKSLRQFIDPCPFLPDNEPRQLQNRYVGVADSVTIVVPVRSWAAVGKAILLRLQQESQGMVVSSPGTAYRLDLPAVRPTAPDTPMIEEAIPSPHGPSGRPNGMLVDEAKEQSVLADSPLDSPLVSPLASNCENGEIADKASNEPSTAGLKAVRDEGISPTDAAKQAPEIDAMNVAAEAVSSSARKRTSEDAGLPEPTEATRVRSKRIKARNAAGEPGSGKGETAGEWNAWYSKQLQIYVQADDLTFQFVDGILQKFNSNQLGSVDQLKKFSIGNTTEEKNAQGSEHFKLRAFKRLLDTWDMAKSRAFIKGGGLQDPTKGAQMLGFSNFLEHSMSEMPRAAVKPALPDDYALNHVAQQAQDNSMETLGDVGTRWLLSLLEPRPYPDDKALYESHQWPDVLKETVVQLLVQLDEHLFSCLREHKSTVSQKVVQSIFELHLDIYGRITNPSSVVDQPTRIIQRDRLCRWMDLASDVANRPSHDQLRLSLPDIRFLWATVVCNNLLEPSSGEDTVICYHDLICVLRAEADEHDGDALVINLVNNALIPEISVAVAEREISKLTTMDFFTTIFRSADEDAFAIIEKLEPLLDLSVGRIRQIASIDADTELTYRSSEGQLAGQHTPDSTVQEAFRFLQRASISLKLFLWQKLRDAYGVINYPSMILSCNFRSITLIVEHLGSSLYADEAQEKEIESYLQWLHKLDELLTTVTALVLTDSNAFECIEDNHIRTLLKSIASLLQILHIFAMWEDSIRVGQTPAPAQPGSTAATAQTKSADKFRGMIIKTWTLLYAVIREGIKQNQELFTSPNDDLLTYLRLIHYSLGLRTYCSLANKMFLRLAKAEMLRLKSVEGWDTDMPQIVYDLHGLKISSNPGDIQEHACEPIDIDKQTAYEVLDTVMLHVNRLTMKELFKNELRYAVDKLQLVIKAPKIAECTATKTFNKGLVFDYLKSPIRPIKLFESLQGLGSLDSLPARTDGWQIAQRGWYFLLGHIALTKFRSSKRIATTSTEDLVNAKTFFRLDLEYDTERWETWYRLGQVFDTLLDEQITWGADKLEKDQAGVTDLQRQAILCYNMAVTISNRSDNITFGEATKLADLYHDYGKRIFSSSREPFSMRAFSLQDHKRPYSKEHNGMYEGQPFTPLLLYPAWKFASVLLRRAAKLKPNDWVVSYTLGKVLWKMYSCPNEIRRDIRRIHYQPILDALLHAVNCVPDKHDARHPDKKPTLEPHYKLLSIVHKLVRIRSVSAEDGCNILQATHYSRGVDTVQNPEEWVDYMLEVLSNMKHADKDNWHHRMVVRSARTIYESDPEDMRTWIGAKHELTQHIFTRTMDVKVWRPDNERTGRHFVYTGRYVRLMLDILFKLKERENVESLAKRIRKKSGEFVHYLGVWYDLCGVYLSILRDRIERQVGFKIVPGFDDIYFKTVNLDEFQANAARIEAWISHPDTTCVEWETLRHAIEFRKLNAKLLKDSIVEETIADIYTAIYAAHAEKLKQKETEEENRARMRVDNVLSNPVTADASVSDANSAQDQTTTKRRFTTITHREVIRRAEALMTKPPPIATPKPAAKTLPSMSLDQGRSPGIAVVIPSHSFAHQSHSSAHQSPSIQEQETMSIPPSTNSVHDSADDESGLSDVEDEAQEYGAAPTMRDYAGSQNPEEAQDKGRGKAPMFPNLFGMSSGLETPKDGTVVEEINRVDGVGEQTREEIDGYAGRLERNGGFEEANPTEDRVGGADRGGD